MANGKIYLASYNGIIKVIEASQKPVVISETKLEGKILATPVIVGNNLYTYFGTFVCLSAVK